MYNGNTNIVHIYPTVTVKCITAIQILFIHTYCDCEMYNGNTNTVHTYPTVTVKYITAIQTLFIHTLL
jgi:hypothetical protein